MTEKKFRQHKLITRDTHRAVCILWDDQVYQAKKEAKRTNTSKDYVIRKALDYYFKIKTNKRGELIIPNDD